MPTRTENRKTGGPPLERPEIFRFHDYRAFLKEWFGYRKAVERAFSLRNLAKEAELSAGYLPMVLSGERELSQKAMIRLWPLLGLNSAEIGYLQHLVTLGSADSQDARLVALEGMKRFRPYQQANPRELEVYRYLTRWYYVAIREMAAMPGFREDPQWIRRRLRPRVPLPEIRAALTFLFENGYLERKEDGTVKLPEKNLDCSGGVYRVALTEFHREMLSLAARSIETVPSEKRQILGHTFALDASKFDEARAIVQDALARLRELEQSSRGKNSLYHAELALFPLTGSDENEEDA